MLFGILPVLPTPFDPEGMIDPVAMASITRFALRGGSQGVVFPGFASEVDELTPTERETLLRVVVEEVAGRVPVVAGASSANVEDVVERCREALSMGVRHVMIQAPKSVGNTADDIGAFYAAIAKAVPDIEIVLQNAPAPRGSDLAPDTILEIVRGNRSIRYVKEETLPAGPAISRILAGKPDHVVGVLGGGGARYIIEELNRGACGAMPAAEIADVHVALYEAHKQGDVALARDLYRRTLPLLVIQALWRMRFTKYVLTKRGVLRNDVVRARIADFDANDRSEIDAWLESIDDLLATAPLVRSAA
ncbi:4-hydroxy-tetrahydrodipicolinate synthase [Faunimonas pinastri]|uniref:4-hydroxy-tetrahydrodipicolinate synthase n=1 Tax=Faunimonas pinastri TaxID=1855383 RepID=A0A1H9EJ22_9HYPH|nr:4-hydroxy-tetrahydrodipicolinate synthase [Faunimonas pinastri]